MVLRLGLAGVIMWFGISQLSNQGMWVGLIPAWATSLSGLSAGALVRLNGIFEVGAAILLAIGWGVRWVAALLFLHLLTIVSDLGLTAVGIRDVGLSFAMLSVALHGSDAWCLEHPDESKKIL